MLKKLLNKIYRIFYYLFYPRIIIISKISKNSNKHSSFVGLPISPIIFIEKSSFSNLLLIHELTHYHQWLRTFMLFGLLNLSSKIRYKFELEAYAYQDLYFQQNYDSNNQNSQDHDLLLDKFATLLTYAIFIKKDFIEVVNDINDIQEKIKSNNQDIFPEIIISNIHNLTEQDELTFLD